MVTHYVENSRRGPPQAFIAGAPGWISTLCVSTPNLLLKPQFEVAYVPQMMIF